MAFIRECYAAFVFYQATIFMSLLAAFPTALIPQLKEEGYQIDTFTESILGSASLWISGIAKFFVLSVSSRVGRKRIFGISFFTSGIGMAIVVFSPNVFAICCGLIISSLTISFSTSIVPCYISEICQREHRGVLLSGTLVVCSLGSGFIFVTQAFLSWRTIAAISALFAFFGSLQTFFIPESKYWRLLKGDEKLARQSAKWFEPGLNDGAIDKMMVDMKQSIAENTSRTRLSLLKFYKLFQRSAFVRPMLKGMLLNFLRIGAGRAFLTVYLIGITRQLRIPYNPKSVAMFFAIAEITGAIVVLPTIRWLRRKTVIYVSSAIMIVSLSTIIAYKVSLDHFDDLIPAWIAVMFLYAYGSVIISAYSSLISVVVSETQSPVTRAEATSIIGGCSTFYFAGHVFLYPYVQIIVPIEYIFSYCVSCIALSALFVYFSYPETSKFEFFENEKRKNVDFESDLKG